jgi:hypothetical protein
MYATVIRKPILPSWWWTSSCLRGHPEQALAFAGPTSPQQSSTPELSPCPYFDAERLVLDADTSWDRVKIIWERARRSSVAS